MSCASCGAFRPVWSHPGTAQEPRRRPQDRPREAQDSLKRTQEASRGAQTRRGAISKRFWSDFGGPETSKNLKKCCTVSEFRGFRDCAREPSTEGQKAPKEDPGEAQMSPRRAPGGPRSGPRAPKMAPRAARSTQDRPRRAPKGPKPPRRLQGALRELILASSWAPRGFIFEPSEVLFDPRARSARQTKALFEITGQKVFRDRCGPDVQRPLSTKLLN